MTEKTKTRINARIEILNDAAEQCSKNNAMDGYLWLSQESWTLNSILIWDYSFERASKELKIQNDTISYLKSVLPKALDSNIDSVVLKNMKEMYQEALGRQRAYLYYLNELNKETHNELI